METAPCNERISFERKHRFAIFRLRDGSGRHHDGWPHHVAIKRQLIGLNAFAMKMFYRGVSFGLRAVMFVTPKAASLLVEEGFKSKEALFQWLKENTFSEGKAKSEQPDMQLDIIVVGGAIQAYQPANMYYNTTASIDQWR